MKMELVVRIWSEISWTDLLHQLLSVRGSLEELLDDADEVLQLDLDVLIVEVVHAWRQQSVRVVNHLRLLPDEPDHTCPGFKFVQGVQIFLFVRTLPGEVLDDNHGLLDHVIDLGLDEVKEGGGAAFYGLVYLHVTVASTNGSHRLSAKLHVNLKKT